MDAFSRGKVAMAHSVDRSLPFYCRRRRLGCAIHKAASRSNYIISTGGGAFLETVKRRNSAAVEALDEEVQVYHEIGKRLRNGDSVSVF
jgi:3-phosphoglycerate kinase